MKNGRRSFPLVALVIVMVVIAVGAAVAIPAFVKHRRRSKTVEAVTNVGKLVDASDAYQGQPVAANGRLLRGPFPASVTSPPYCCGGPCRPLPSDFTDAPAWSALNFTVDDPFYYTYLYPQPGSHTPSELEMIYNNDMCSYMHMAFPDGGVPGGSGSRFTDVPE